MLAFAHGGHAKVGQIIQELPFSGKVPSNRKLDVSERVSDGEKTISQYINRKQMGIGNTLCPRRANQFEGTTRAALGSGMANISLIFQFWDQRGSKHVELKTKYSYVVNSY